MPTAKKVPEAFTDQMDSLSMGDVLWSEFFNDSLLVELIDIALQNNLDLLTAIQRVEVARANLRLRKGALMPSVNGQFTANVGSGVNNNLTTDPSENRSGPNIGQNYFLGLQSSWEVDLWGKLRNRREAAYARFIATEKGRQLVETSLVAEVARMYYELLSLDKELETIEKNINYQEIALEMINIQKIGGRATELAVQQFSAQLLRTRSLGAEKRQRIIEVENQLNLLLGRYPQHITRGESIIEQHLPEVIKVGVPSDMLLRRPDIQQAELELVAAKADVEAARAAFLPSVNLNPYLGFNSNDMSLIFKTPESIAIGFLGDLTAPIFNKNVIRSEFDRSSARNLEAYYNYQQTILNGYQEVMSSLNRVENYREVYELREQETEVLTNAVTTSNDLFAAGYATYLEVITAQERVLEAELSMTNTRKEIFVSVIDLYRALGGGWQ